MLATFNQLQVSLPPLGEDKHLVVKTAEKPPILFDLAKNTQLLKDFSKLEMPPEQKKAFLEIIGLNHLESVSSKLLEFFFDTEEAHGLNDLCMQALYDCITKSITERPYIKTKSVEQEVVTDENSRIDIVIDTYDDLIIIENKLFHTINNPFATYVHYGEQRREGQISHYVVLGIKPPEQLYSPFIFISHFELTKAIQRHFGEYVMNADPHYVTLLVDYLHALDNFNPNSRIGKMGQAIVNFFGNNHKQILEMMNARRHFIEYGEQQLEKVKTLLLDKGITLFKDDLIGENDSIAEGWLGYEILTKEIIAHPTAIENGISYSFYIAVYSECTHLAIFFNGKLQGRGTPKDCLLRLENILNRLGIEYETPENLEEDTSYLPIKNLAWNETPENIVAQFLPILEKIQEQLPSLTADNK